MNFKRKVLIIFLTALFAFSTAFFITSCYFEPGLQFRLSDGKQIVTKYNGTAKETEVVIPAEWEGYPVTAIDTKAFYDSQYVISITIPDSVTYIAEDAFGHCENLESIIVLSGNPVYHSAGNCIIETATKTLVACCNTSVIPADGSVTSIGNYAFQACGRIKSIIIPDSVTSIGQTAFNDCDNLESITVSSGNTVYHSAGNCIIETATKTLVTGCKTSVIPADGSVTSIGEYAFAVCLRLTSVEIPDSVISIGNYAFYSCDNLESVTLGNNSKLISIGDCAFKFCYLANITIPDSVTHIGKEAFYNCINLKSVAFGKNSKLDFVGDYAFDYCISLKNINIPDNVTHIGKDAFYGTAYYKSDSNWTNGVLYIGNHLVGAKTDISGSYTIKSGTLTISDYAFSKCTRLDGVTIPDSVTSIGNYSFAYSDNLMTVVIGQNVTYIGFCAFDGCINIKGVHYGGTWEQWQQIIIESGNSCLTNAMGRYINNI